MGNSVVSAISAQPRGSTGKVILWDGSVREFGGDAGLTVAELMLDHPQQAVVELRAAAVASKRPAALAADTRLETRKVYLMLPMRRGGKAPSALSAEEVRRAVLAANSALRARASAAGLVPMLVRMCRPAAALPVKIRSDRGCAAAAEEKKFVSLEGFLGERTDYLSRQFSGKRGNWKPSLDTIEEKTKVDQKKVSHWLY